MKCIFMGRAHSPCHGSSHIGHSTCSMSSRFKRRNESLRRVGSKRVVCLLARLLIDLRFLKDPHPALSPKTGFARQKRFCRRAVGVSPPRRMKSSPSVGVHPPLSLLPSLCPKGEYYEVTGSW